ncbi:hypothetical protein [Streptomyces sp. NPDC050988]|uniref:hypothetical protein n=1 Tax=Streptomyces sp. NPDC050988 TaxID=3365637 RepID=UPI0037B1CF29
MSVSVVLVNKASSEFKDAESEGRYYYLLDPGGALRVMVTKGGQSDRTHKAYGPSAWLSVEGQSGKP